MWMLCLCLLVVMQACSVENACITGKKYCGNSDSLRHITVHGNKQDPKALFACLEDGQNATCNASCDGELQCYQGSSYAEAHCRQPCKINNLYCGHQLASMTGWNTSVVSYRSSTIFKCDLMPHTNMVDGTALQTCHLGCQAERGQSSCAKCDPGRPYCSSELVSDASTAENSVYLCDANGTDLIRIGECSSCHQGHCFDQDSLYCGSLLPSFGSSNYLTDGLYKCDNGTYTLHTRCTNGCIAHAHRSHCACVPSAFYCADELKSIGYYGLSTQGIYMCRNKTTVVERTYCYDKCVQGQCCAPDSLFCGSELLPNSRANNYLPNGLYECDNGNFKLRKRCASSCIAQKPRAHCGCVPSASYCGHELMSLGYRDIHWSNTYICKNKITLPAAFCTDACIHGQCCKRGDLFCGSELTSARVHSHLPDGLYECGSEKVKLRMHCSTGCVPQKPQSHCACVPSTAYCGHELQALGYQILRENAIHMCINESTSSVVRVSLCRDKCIEGHCCDRGRSFCGSELLSFRGNSYLPHGLYKCRNGSFTLRTQCSTGCVPQKLHSHCACVPSTAYCGHELQPLGYHNLRMNAIHMCINESTSPVPLVSSCAGKCIEGNCCDRDSSFCGSELLSSRWNSYLPHGLYKCRNRNFMLHTHCSNGCIAKKPESHCACGPSAVYCGHELQPLGFRDIHADSIYTCRNATTLLVINQKTCYPHSCGTEGYVHCSHSCTVGSVYCGYENAVREHQELANRIDNALYLCTAEYYFLHQESCRHDCIARDTTSECNRSALTV